ncbi:MAG: DNA polymerase [Desulfomonilaceae bacterium]
MLPDNWLSILESPSTVALTAPLVMDKEVLIGYALSPEEGYCASLSLDEFTALCPSIYLDVSSPRIFHGLKRIWEFLDDRGLRTDTDIDKHLGINKIEDTKLLAYLLDPDSAREVEFGEHRVQEELTLAHLCSRYLGNEYPYRNTDIYESKSNEAFAEVLAHDARLIYRLAAELPGRMSEELCGLYRHLELPLMIVLDNMRRVGIGVDGAACACEVNRIEKEMAILAQEITSGEDVDLRSDRAVFRFLVKRGVRFQDQRVYQWGRVTNRALEDIAPIYPVVQEILSFREKGQDLGSLRQMADQNRIHPIWGQTRSATSRIYARSPGVQNISRELRHLFVPTPGHVLIKADYSQAQMRILAHLSQDPELMKIFQDPKGDVHTETSKRLGLNDRNIAKEINFAISFGMGAAGLCSKINELKKKQGSTDFIGLDTAQFYIEGFYRRFPKVKEFFDGEWAKLKKLPSQERVVRSLLGRERCFQRRPSSEMERRFRVTWPQQIEADLIKTAMVRLDRILRRRNMKARIVMVIHDALWLEAPHEEAEPVRHLLRKMMITAAKLKVPLEVDIK